jgi:hypothetical protein
MTRKTRTKAYSTNILDYHSNLSMYEKDSLASEAKLADERKTKKQPKLPPTEPRWVYESGTVLFDMKRGSF